MLKFNLIYNLNLAFFKMSLFFGFCFVLYTASRTAFSLKTEFVTTFTNIILIYCDTNCHENLCLWNRQIKKTRSSKASLKFYLRILVNRSLMMTSKFVYQNTIVEYVFIGVRIKDILLRQYMGKYRSLEHGFCQQRLVPHCVVSISIQTSGMNIEKEVSKKNLQNSLNRTRHINLGHNMRLRILNSA